ncbi:hypothetical protein CPC08DRAFT_136937 [Agrocybe pediades]|nr:hypothetical protein CPC08DRAFT_136937 [Agrocybe pediades]
MYQEERNSSRHSDTQSTELVGLDTGGAARSLTGRSRRGATSADADAFRYERGHSTGSAQANAGSRGDGDGGSRGTHAGDSDGCGREGSRVAAASTSKPAAEELVLPPTGAVTVTVMVVVWARTPDVAAAARRVRNAEQRIFGEGSKRWRAQRMCKVLGMVRGRKKVGWESFWLFIPTDL